MDDRAAAATNRYTTLSDVGDGAATDEDRGSRASDADAKATPPSPTAPPAAGADGDDLAPPPGFYKKLAALGVAMFGNTLNLSILFPYLKFMVEDFGVAEADAGYYVGLIAAAFMAGRCVTSVFWGWFADRHGRKPAMLISLAALVVLSPVFGVATSVWMAASVRFVMGMLNSLVGIGKVMASELAPACPHLQTQAMSVVSVAWGVAMVIGPGTGGMLSSTDGMGLGSPYLPPMLFVATLAGIAGVSAVLYLPETLPKDQAALSEHRVPWHALIASKNVMWAIGLYGTFSYQALANTELLNLWAATERGLGGLGLTRFELGILQTVAGAVMLVFQLFVMPTMAKRYGLRGLALTTCAVYIPLQVSYPLLRVVPATGNKVGLLVLFAALLAITNTISSFFFTVQFLFINNSTHAANRAVVQGVAMTLASVTKALGPGSIGAIFAWSINEPRPLFLSYPLGFLVLGASLVACLALVYWLPPELIAAPKKAEVDAEADADARVDAGAPASASTTPSASVSVGAGAGGAHALEELGSGGSEGDGDGVPLRSVRVR